MDNPISHTTGIIILNRECLRGLALNSLRRFFAPPPRNCLLTTPLATHPKTRSTIVRPRLNLVFCIVWPIVLVNLGFPDNFIVLIVLIVQAKLKALVSFCMLIVLVYKIVLDRVDPLHVFYTLNLSHDDESRFLFSKHCVLILIYIIYVK